MDLIVLFRRKTGKAPKKAPGTIKKILKKIAETARVKRDELVSFLLGGGFKALPVVPQSVIDSPTKRKVSDGFVIPVGSLGRKGKATPEQAESIRLWVKKNVVPHGIDPDTVSVVFVKGKE